MLGVRVSISGGGNGRSRALLCVEHLAYRQPTQHGHSVVGAGLFEDLLPRGVLILRVGPVQNPVLDALATIFLVCKQSS